MQDLHEVVPRSKNAFKVSNSELKYMVVLDDKFYCLYSVYDKTSKIQNLYAIEINPKTAKFKDESRILISIDGKVGEKHRLFFEKADKFDVEFSKDRKRMLIHFRMKSDQRKDELSYENIGLYVFDGSLNKLYGDIREMKYTEAQMDIVDYSVDSEGASYLMMKVYKSTDLSRKERNDDIIDYNYELMKLADSASYVKYTALELDDKRFIKSAKLYEKDAGNMVIGGYYSTTSKLANGLFVFTLNKQTKDYTKNYYAFPMEILNQNATKAEIRKNEKDNLDGGAGFRNLFFDHIHVDEEGNMILTGEEYWVEIKERKDAAGRTNQTFEYHFADILTTKIKANCELDWMVRIPKNQVGAMNRGGMSYCPFYNEKAAYFLYADNSRNFNLPEDARPAKQIDGKYGFLTSTKINFETGEVSKEHLFDLKDVNGMKVKNFSTRSIVRMEDDAIATDVSKGNKEDVWLQVGVN